MLDEDRDVGLLVDRGEAIGWKYYGFMQKITDALGIKSCMIPTDSSAGKQILEMAKLVPLYEQNESHQQTMQTMEM